jgi:phosphate uptake regulator
MSSNPEGNKENSTIGGVPPEVDVTGNVPMILSPIPASQVESASGSVTISISRVNVEKYIIKDIAKRHLGLALMELLGVTLARAAEQGKSPEEAKKISDFIERLGHIADAVLETQLDYIFDVAPQIQQAIEKQDQLAQVLIKGSQVALGSITQRLFSDEMFYTFIVDCIRSIKQEASARPNVVKEALKEVKEELKQLVALAES